MPDSLLIVTPVDPNHDTTTRTTVEMDPLMISSPSTAVAIATLEKIGPWAVDAFKIGTLAILEQLVREMGSPDAKVDLIMKTREIVEVLAHMHWEL